jgi:hypothetical protein
MDLEKDAEQQVEFASRQATVAPAGSPSTSKPGRNSRSLMLGAVVALAIVGASWFAAASFNHPAEPHIGISTTTGNGSPFGGPNFLAADNQVTDRQWQERAAAFAAFRAKGPVLLDRLPLTQGLDYIGKSITDPNLKTDLARGVQDQKIEMVAIGFYDDCAEDGDVVRVQSGGVDVTVPLYHQVQYVELPVPKGGQALVTVSGIKDGTGGITLGMVTPTGDVHMPRLQPGEQVSFVAK